MIETLSEKQIATVIGLRKTWSELPLRTDPLDRGAAEAAVKQFYCGMKLAEPRIVWCDSPLGILLADTYSESQLISRAGDRCPVPLDEPVLDWLTRRFESSLTEAEWAPVRLLGRQLSYAALQSVFEFVTGSPLVAGKQLLGLTRFSDDRWSSNNYGWHNGACPPVVGGPLH